MTLAAKHLDPVLGIDIHIIQPPGPVPPLPIPHPFIGMLIDPMDYAPIVGSTVQINSMHRAQAGTAGKNLPPHIPIGGVFVPPPPGNECEMFMGSATVCIDGEAQSYMGLPALSCQSVGMPSIPRMTPKKKTIPKCLMLPTSVVVAIPGGPPVLIGGPPTISLMQMGMKVGMKALGKLGKGLRKLQRGGSRFGKAMQKVSKAARKKVDDVFGNGKVGQALKKSVCSVTGHPVDIATGKMFTDAVDFTLPGPLPLTWERTYYSTSPYDGPLGHGWHHSYDMALTEQEDVVGVRLPEGRSVCFHKPDIGESSFDRSERMTLHRDIDGYSMRDTDGLLYKFSEVVFDTETQALSSVEDRAGNVIEFGYDKYGHLEFMHDSCGRKLTVTTDTDGRILKIRAPHPDEPNQTISLVSYEYDIDHRLIEVRDALDQPMTFVYEGFLMVQETDRNGLSFYFEYDGTDHDARCTRTWGDGGIYNHSLDYDLELQRTVVTNSLGQQTTHFWHESGLVYRAVDAYGKAVATVYNDFQQPDVLLDELGQPTTFEYDERGNQIAVVNPDGSSLSVNYNEHDQPTRAIDPLGNLWSWDYNQRGQLVRRVDASGRETRFNYDGRRLAAVIDPANNATEVHYDLVGNLDAVTTPDGTQSRWQYDALGRPTEVTTPGGIQKRTYDLLGRITKVVEPDGNFRSLAYDAVGNVIHAKDLQHDVRFTYQGMGRLVSRREAGTTVEFKYNTEEDLTGIVNEHGYAYRFELDARGDVAKEYGFDDIRRIYTRDDAGRVIRVERASGLITRYEYDPAGRVIAVKHSDGDEETYAYREDGELVEASNSACTIKFERDESGRIVKEWQDDYWVASEYDATGLRKEMRSCFGAIQKIDRNAMGDVVGMQYMDAQRDAEQVSWEAKIERDALGLELERSLSGGIRSRWERDKLGRPIRHQILAASTQGRDVTYQWDVNDRLRKIVDAHNGTTVFQHDEVGNLAAATYGDGTEELRMPDAVGNLFRTKDRSDRKYGKAGQILESRDEDGVTTYEYDDEGNLIRKSTPDGDWIYTWNATGMLQSVERPDGELVEFEYDPVGRRISKTFRGRTTRWIWDASRPLHEWAEGGAEEYAELQSEAAEESSGRPPAELSMAANPATGPPDENGDELISSPLKLITWLFDPESFAPAAKIVDDEQYSIVTDYLGTSTAMLDSSGNLVWRADKSAYGELRSVEGDREACPFRYLGQQEDIETGLYYNRFRYYDPQSGCYTSQDPLGLVTDAYNYVRRPERSSDPFGLSEWVDPSTLNYSQAYVTGETDTYEKAMRDGDWDWDRTSKRGNPVAVLTVAEVDGQLVSFDNRRLLAAQNAGLDKVKVARVNLDDIKPGTNITWQQSLDKRLNSKPKGFKVPRVQLPANGSPNKPKVCT